MSKRKSSKIKRLYTSVLTLLSPTLNTKVLYKRYFKKPLNLKSPKTLNEKILWLKLNCYYKNPLITQCADKYAVREYVKARGCEEILNELYGVYSDLKDIEWEKFPEKFVLKLNYGCGYNLICQEKSHLNINQIKKVLNSWKKSRMHLWYSEMQYKDIKRKFICEKYLENREGLSPEDYKFYCFNGSVEYVMVCCERESGNPKFYYFDKNWIFMKNFSADGIKADVDFYLPKPEGFEKMIAYACKLSQEFPFVRVDLYYCDRKIIFGELTFTPGAALDNTRPPEIDLLFGKMLHLEID